MNTRVLHLALALVAMPGPRVDGQSVGAPETIIVPSGALQRRIALFFIHAANDYSVAPAQVLDAEAQRTGRPHRMKIYPPLGHSAAEGHNFIYRGMPVWKRDVLAFLEANVRRP